MTLLCRVDGQCFGLAVNDVERVVPAAEITPVPQAPEVISGLVNIHGTLTPVFDLRRRLNGRASPVSLSARFVVLRRTGLPMALLVEQADELYPIPDEAMAAVEALVPGAGWLRGAAPAHDGVILVQDPEALLSDAEAADLDLALRAAAQG